MKDNKDNIVIRDKIIAFILWILVWWIVVYAYWSYTGRWSMMFPSQKWVNWISTRLGNFDAGSMTDAQLERMATRAGITLAELKKRLAAWETLRDIMPARSWSGARSGWNFQWRESQNITTGTWSN